MRARYKQFPPSGVKYIATQGFNVIMKRDQMLWFLATTGPGLTTYRSIIREGKMSVRDLKGRNKVLCKEAKVGTHLS